MTPGRNLYMLHSFYTMAHQTKNWAEIAESWPSPEKTLKDVSYIQPVGLIGIDTVFGSR